MGFSVTFIVIDLRCKGLYSFYVVGRDLTVAHTLENLTSAGHV